MCKLPLSYMRHGRILCVISAPRVSQATRLSAGVHFTSLGNMFLVASQ